MKHKSSQISSFKDAMHHIVSKTDKTFKLEVKYINAVKGKVVSDVIYWLITVIYALNRHLVATFFKTATNCRCIFLERV